MVTVILNMSPYYSQRPEILSKTSLLKTPQTTVSSLSPLTTKIQLQITVPYDIFGTYLFLSLFVNLAQLPQLLQNSLALPP